MRALFLRFGVIAALPVAQTAAFAATDPPPEKARELLRLLSDPELQRWMTQQGVATAPAAAASAATPSDGNLLAGQIDAMRGHKVLLASSASPSVLALRPWSRTS